MKTQLTKPLLVELYHTQGKSTRAIAKMTGWSQPTVRRKMIAFGIPRRGYDENPMPVAKGSHLPRAHRQAISDAQKALVAQGKRRYDGEHSPAWKGGLAAVSCAWCGNTVYRWPGYLAKYAHVFCPGTDCFRRWQSERTTGIHGKDHNAWKGGHRIYYGGSWERQRQLCLERDGHRCQDCGQSHLSLHAHHIVSFAGYECHVEANRLDNLVTVCPRCHRRRHS